MVQCRRQNILKILRYFRNHNCVYCLPNSHSTAALGSCSSVWQNSTAAFISLHLLSNHYHAIYGERICAILDCCIFQKVAFLKIKYPAHPVSLENRLETLPQTYAYPGQSLCRCKTLAAELIQMFERARRLYQMLERYGRSEIILSQMLYRQLESTALPVLEKQHL